MMQTAMVSLRNSFINRYRKAQKRPEEVDFAAIEEVLETLVADRERPAGPEQELLSKSMDEPLESALRALPEEYRMVLILAVVEGFSYKEIAAALNCPIGTVMSRLHRARKQMQARLLGYARERGWTNEAPAATDPGEESDVSARPTEGRPEIG